MSQSFPVSFPFVGCWPCMSVTRNGGRWSLNVKQADEEQIG